jgi:hypothetical protein
MMDGLGGSEVLAERPPFVQIRFCFSETGEDPSPPLEAKLSGQVQQGDEIRDEMETNCSPKTGSVPEL